jgi:hypothetical protein
MRASSFRASPVFAIASALLAQAPSPLHLPLDAADATWHGAVPIADGKQGGAARFDGAGAHIDAGPCPVGDHHSFTLRCWLRTGRGAFCTPLMARDGEAVGLSLVIGREPGKLSFEAWSWQTERIVSRQRVDDGHWHRIEVAYDHGQNLAILRIDGVQQGFAELGPGGSPRARLRLGDNIGAQQPFAGDLDDVEFSPTIDALTTLPGGLSVLSAKERSAALGALRGRILPKTTPSLAASAAANWHERRAAVRAHVADALGLAPTPPRPPHDAVVHGEIVRDGVRLQRISWIGFPGLRATGWLWSPAEPSPGRRPAVLCPHGHWPGGAMHPVVQARCAAFAQFGWTALAVDSVHVEDVAAGVSAIGAMTWHNQRALDLLLARDDVDAARIACTGASGGAQQTYYLMALEDRLAAAAPMVMACYFAEIVDDTTAHCACNHPPRLAAGTDVIEMCACFAPRPVMFGSVTGDWTKHFPREGLPELTAHWTRLGGDAPRSRHAAEEHNYDRPMREQVYAFLHDALLGREASGAARATVAEPTFAPFAFGELQRLARHDPANRLDRAAAAKEHLARRARAADLAALAPGLDFAVAPRPIVWHDPEAADHRRGSVVGADGVPIPFHATRDSPLRHWYLWIDPRGARAAMADSLPAAGRSVFVDPRPYGEWSRFRSAWQRNGLLLGRGEAYQAAVDVALVAASLPDENAEVYVAGAGEAGVVALLAARLCPRITHVWADPGPSFAEDGNRLPLCPEIRRWGDVADLVAALGTERYRGPATR